MNDMVVMMFVVNMIAAVAHDEYEMCTRDARGGCDMVVINARCAQRWVWPRRLFVFWGTSQICIVVFVGSHMRSAHYLCQ